MPLDHPPLTGSQLSRLGPAFHAGAAQASQALAGWLNASTTMTIDSIDQCRLADATGVLGEAESVVCMCLMEMQGTLTGHMLLAFDDRSGLALSDLLLSRSSGTTSAWGEVETSCVLETMNIAGSAYLNGIAGDLSERTKTLLELIPTPPRFLRDYAESLLQAAFLDQAASAGDVVFAKASFDLAGQPLRWTFLLIPDPSSLERLSVLLTGLT